MSIFHKDLLFSIKLTKNLFSSRGENDEHVFFDYQSVGVSLP